MGVFIQEVSLQKHNITSFNNECFVKLLMYYYNVLEDENNVTKHIVLCLSHFSYLRLEFYVKLNDK